MDSKQNGPSFGVACFAFWGALWRGARIWRHLWRERVGVGRMGPGLDGSWANVLRRNALFAAGGLGFGGGGRGGEAAGMAVEAFEVVLEGF